MTQVPVPEARRGGPPLSLVVALILLAFGGLKLAEGIADRSFEGVGGIIVGVVLLLPSVVRVLRRENPHFILSIIALVLIGAGVTQLAGVDIPWEAILMIAGGGWLLLVNLRRR